MPAVSYNNVTFRYSRGDQPAVEGITFDVEQGQRLGILGPNGGGKSTLLNLTLGLLTPQRGTIKVFGEDPGTARRRGLIGTVPQRSEAELGFPLSVRQVVELGAKCRVGALKNLSAEARSRVAQAMEETGVDEYADRPIGRLSGGQRQRALVARAVAAAPQLLLLDEPTVGVDVEGQHLFRTMLDRLRDRFGLTIIVVSHDIRTIAATSDRVACLRRTLHEHVDPRGLTPELLAQVFRHDVEEALGEPVHIDAHRAADCDDPSHDPHKGHHEHL